MALIIAIFAICVQGGIWRGGTATIVAGGFGIPSVSYLIGEGLYGPQRSPATASLLANLPQLVVSYIYVVYNSLVTSMLATAEWVGYSISPRGLRVTWPKGHQRSRAFLQLPYIYALPIMTASTLLHWLIYKFYSWSASQSTTMAERSGQTLESQRSASHSMRPFSPFVWKARCYSQSCWLGPSGNILGQHPWLLDTQHPLLRLTIHIREKYKTTWRSKSFDGEF